MEKILKLVLSDFQLLKSENFPQKVRKYYFKYRNPKAHALIPQSGLATTLSTVLFLADFFSLYFHRFFAIFHSFSIDFSRFFAFFHTFFMKNSIFSIIFLISDIFTAKSGRKKRSDGSPADSITDRNATRSASNQ